MQDEWGPKSTQENEMPPAVPDERKRWWHDYLVALTVYLLTLAPCLLGTLLGLNLMQPKGDWYSRSRTEQNPSASIEALSQWDGGWYVAIARNGYFYDGSGESPVEYFPAYPCCMALLAKIVPSFSPHFCGLVLSHGFLLASFVLLLKRMDLKFPGWSRRVALDAILLLVLYPSSFWLRMVDAESMFLFLALLFFWALEKKWGWCKTALIAGLATATYPVGIALSVVFLVDLINHGKNRSLCCLKIVGYAVLSLWGLLLFIAYLGLVFGEPFAFVKTVEFWNGERLRSLLSFQPVWETFDLSVQYELGRVLRGVPAILHYQIWNALLFLVALLAIFVGVVKKWITCYEFAFAFLLLLIPYVTMGDVQHLAGQARFVLVIFPVFIVLGMLLSKLPKTLAIGILAISAFFQFIFAAQQACGGYFVR